MSLHTQLRKYMRAYSRWRLAPQRLFTNTVVKKYGTEYGGYYLDESKIHEETVVYSAGIGEDISFDMSLIECFGVEIEAFDPTPKVKTWVESQKCPEQFHFHNVGIADFDGEAVFYLPPRPDFVSHSVVRARQYSQESIRVPMIRLSTAMQQLGHSRIDILKMDIEGAEYAVIEDVVREKIPVGQIVVEFHHRLSSVGTAKTKRILSLLDSYGMKIAYICPRMEVFTLVRAA